MNFGEMVAQIADDLVDERLTTPQIQNAVNQALRFYSRKTFYFNKIKTAVSVLVGTEYYALTNTAIFIADLYTIQTVKFTPTGEDGYPLTQTYDYKIEEAKLNTDRAPTHWSYAEMQLRLYPVPNKAGTCSILATYMYPRLTGDAETNPFLERADELIRQAAKRYLAFNILHDSGLGDRCAALEAEEFASIVAESLAREPIEPLEVGTDLAYMTGNRGTYNWVTDI